MQAAETIATISDGTLSGLKSATNAAVVPGKLAGENGYDFILNAGQTELIDELIPHVFHVICEKGGSIKSTECMDRVKQNAGITDDAWNLEWYVDRNANTNRLKVRHGINWAIYKLRQTGYIRRSNDSATGIWNWTDFGKQEKDKWFDPANWNEFKMVVKKAFAKTKRAKNVESAPAEATANTAVRYADEEAAIKADEASIPDEDALLDALKSLSWDKVEDLVAIVANNAEYVACRRLAKGRGRDGGIDLWARRPVGAFHQIPVAFQVKRTEKEVGSPDIQQFVGACELFRCQCDKVFVSIYGFNGKAQQYAMYYGVDLVSGEQLLEAIEKSPKAWATIVKRPEFAPLVTVKRQIEKSRIDASLA